MEHDILTPNKLKLLILHVVQKSMRKKKYLARLMKKLQKNQKWKPTLAMSIYRNAARGAWRFGLLYLSLLSDGKPPFFFHGYYYRSTCRYKRHHPRFLLVDIWCPFMIYKEVFLASRNFGHHGKELRPRGGRVKDCQIKKKHGKDASGNWRRRRWRKI